MDRERNPQGTVSLIGKAPDLKSDVAHSRIAGSSPAPSASFGALAERPIAPVSKTGLPQGNVGSNPTRSASLDSWVSGLNHLLGKQTNRKVPRVRLSHYPPVLWSRGREA